MSNTENFTDRINQTFAEEIRLTRQENVKLAEERRREDEEVRKNLFKRQQFVESCLSKGNILLQEILVFPSELKDRLNVMKWPHHYSMLPGNGGPMEGTVLFSEKSEHMDSWIKSLFLIQRSAGLTIDIYGSSSSRVDLTAFPIEASQYYTLGTEWDLVLQKLTDSDELIRLIARAIHDR